MLTGIVPFDQLNVPDPIAVGVDAVGVGWLAPIIKLGIVFGLTSVILVMLLAQPRIFRAMAHDGLLPAVCRENSSALPHALCLDDRLRHRRRHSRRAVADRAGGRTRQHRNAVRVRRRFDRHAGAARHRSAIATPVPRPAIWLVGPAAAATSIFLMFGLPVDTWIRLGVWLIIGLAIYAVYGARHSRLRASDNE